MCPIIHCNSNNIKGICQNYIFNRKIELYTESHLLMSILNFCYFCANWQLFIIFLWDNFYDSRDFWYIFPFECLNSPAYLLRRRFALIGKRWLLCTLGDYQLALICLLPSTFFLIFTSKLLSKKLGKKSCTLILYSCVR